jgi:hypothetical protein
MKTSLSVVTLSSLAAVAAAGTARAETCDAPPLAGVTCALENGALVVQSEAGRMALRGRWQAAPDGMHFTTRRGFAVLTPAGELPIPAGDVTVSCDGGFAVTGELTQMPDFGELFPGATLETHAPTVAFGMGRGDTLAAMDAPVDPCRTYAFFALDSSVSGGLAGIALGQYGGDQALIAVDPFDPGFLISVGGDHVSAATAGFVASAGLGVSSTGLIPWSSALPLPTGEGDATVPIDLDAHVYLAAEVGLVPIPRSPVQIYLDAVVAADLGALGRAAPRLARELRAGELTDITAVVAADAGVSVDTARRHLRLGANAEHLTLAFGSYSLDLGHASLVVDDGRATFAAQQWSPGPGFHDRGDAEPASTGLPALDSLLSHALISETLGVRGYVERDRVHLELEADLVVGPLEIEGARIVIDSVEGVRIERDDLDVDVEAFVERLENIFRCDFARGVAGCSVGGFRVLAARARIVEGAIDMKVRLDLLGLAEGQFSLRNRPGGDFVFALSVGNGAALGPYVTRNLKLVLTERGVNVESEVAVLGSGHALRGTLRRVGNEIRFRLAGQFTSALAGFPKLQLRAELSNEKGPAALALDGEASLADLVPGFSPGTVRFHGDVDARGRYELAGLGRLRVYQYDLGMLSLALSNKPGRSGLSVKGVFDSPFARVRLSGLATPNRPFTLTGTADLTADGYTLVAAGFTLSGPDALVARGQLHLGGLTLEGTGAISSRGAVAISASAELNIPVVAGLEVLQRGVECGTRTVTSALECGTQTFYDAAHCGETLIQDAARCGNDLVEVGRETVTDASLCGYVAAECGTRIIEGTVQYGANAAKCGFDQFECGTDIVRDGTICGYEMVQDKVPLMGQCAADWWACALRNLEGIYCDPVGNPPASCLEFAAPKSCTVPKMCDEPASCEYLSDPYEVPAMCDVPATCERVIRQEMPRSCNIVVPCDGPATCDVKNYCDRLVREPAQTLGTYMGRLTATLGEVFGLRMHGTYCDTQGYCSGWSVDATLRGEGTGSPEVCVPLALEMLPVEAVLSAFAPDGRPEFCAPL